MSQYFAQINLNNIVERVIVISSEKIAQKEGTWIETWLDGGPRVNYAGIGFHYDPENDVFFFFFIYPSWVLNEETWQWDPPVPYPEDGKDYEWNEDYQEWQEIVIEEPIEETGYDEEVIE